MQEALGSTYDGRIFRIFRGLLGLVLVAIPVRNLAYGWLDLLYLAPTYRFAWVEGLPPTRARLLVLFAVLGICGALVTVGRGVRPAALVYLVGFLWLESLDKTLYLNHYVLLTLLLTVLCLVPDRDRVPAWVVWGVRALLASVYLHAGLCKLSPDWLLRGEPMHTWLLARQGIPVVGPWLAWGPTALAMSWGGALYDLTVPALLLARPTRTFGFALVVGFHLITWALFPIGVFPWVMLAGSLMFLPMGPRLPGPAVGRPGAAAFALAVVAMALVPLRHHLVPGNVNWHEQGYRFAWRVLLIEKTGLVDFIVELPDGRRIPVRPSAELTELQHKQMRTQPDLILQQYARHLGRVHGARSVTVDSFASLNGRPVQRLVRPDVNLLEVDWRTPIMDWTTPLEP